MQDGTYPPRNFATLGPSELQPPFARHSIRCVNISFWVYSTGQASIPILHFTILQRSVFLINSRCSHFHDTTIFLIMVLLLPKLQSYFAEFLQYCYFNRLSISYQFTCVGLQYGLFNRYFLAHFYKFSKYPILTTFIFNKFFRFYSSTIVFTFI